MWSYGDQLAFKGYPGSMTYVSISVSYLDILVTVPYLFDFPQIPASQQIIQFKDDLGGKETYKSGVTGANFG